MKHSIKMKNVIDREEKSKMPNDVKPVENINKNLKSFLKVSLVQNKSFLHINCKIMHESFQIKGK